MSARVVSGLAPAGKPHPATKWSLLMVLLVVVMLGVPKIALAGQPSVQPPTGPQSGGVFTGTFTFNTYISCTNGASFPSSYSSNLDGTNTFAFYGSADGSLLVSVNGGGMMLVTSCGDPFTGPDVNVANYTVSKNTTPPPTPTPTPSTPTPTPTPSGGSSGGGTSGGSSSGGGTGAGHATTTAVSSKLTPTPSAPASSPAAIATPTGQPTLSPSPAAGAQNPNGGPSSTSGRNHSAATATGATAGFDWFMLVWLALVGVLVAVGVIGWRQHRWGERLHELLTPWRLRMEPYVFRLRFWLRHAVPIHGRDQPKRRGLSAHHHSGKVLAHHHTSYPALAFLLLLSGVLAGVVGLSSQAANSTLSLSVLGPPPSTAATIDQPLDGDEFTTNTTTVRGTCPVGLLIEIYRNTTFAGSSTCDSSGLYSVLVTLDAGSNALVARDADALGQYGPDSNTVTVTYTPPPPPPSPSPSPTPSATPTAPAGGNPAARRSATPTPSPSSASGAGSPSAGAAPTLTSDQHFYQGVEVGDPVTWQIRVAGGTSPYHFTWDAGDGTSATATDLAQPGTASQTHTYTQPGMYQMTVRVRDGLGRESALQLAVIVNGQAAGGVTAKPESDAGNLVMVWPALTVTSLLVVSFWLGAQHIFSVQRALARWRPAASSNPPA